MADAVHKFPSVHIGRQYLSQAESDYDVRRTVTTAIHGSYDPATSANDIALLRLDAASTKAPLALPTFDLVPANNTPLSVLGFGTTSEGGMYLSSGARSVLLCRCWCLAPQQLLKPPLSSLHRPTARDYRLLRCRHVPGPVPLRPDQARHAVRWRAGWGQGQVKPQGPPASSNAHSLPGSNAFSNMCPSEPHPPACLFIFPARCAPQLPG